LFPVLHLEPFLSLLTELQSSASIKDNKKKGSMQRQGCVGVTRLIMLQSPDPQCNITGMHDYYQCLRKYPTDLQTLNGLHWSRCFLKRRFC